MWYVSTGKVLVQHHGEHCVFRRVIVKYSGIWFGSSRESLKVLLVLRVPGDFAITCPSLFNWVHFPFLLAGLYLPYHKP